jgi:oligopeptide/dipeptide ABC transporter ATP-binding protein
MNASSPPPLLRVRDFTKHFELKRKGFGPPQMFRAIEGISFDLHAGDTLGIVGESGSGKTTLGRALLRAITPTSGEAVYDDGELRGDLAVLSERGLRPFRRRMQMIFQDPFSSLNPRMTVGDIIAEPLVVQKIGTSAERIKTVEDILDRVGLKPEHKSRYPHAFSGGQRQRIGIARALVLRPRLIVCDEALSALDVSVQAQIINLLMELREEYHLTYLFIAHDLGVIRHLCTHVGVMYSGRLVEYAPTAALFSNPQHPYTRMLLESIPDPHPDRVMTMRASGEPPSAGAKDFCAFAPRCAFATEQCMRERPELESLPGARATACWNHIRLS